MPRTKLKKRKDGRFRKVYAGVPFYGLTEKEATDKANAYKRDLEAGLRAEQAGITVQEYANRWVQIHKANVSLNQYNDYVRRLNTVCIYIGNKRMRDVVMSDIQLVYNELMTGKSKSSITKYASMIKSLFSAAQIDRIIMHNPCLAAKPPKGYAGSHRALEDWERDAVHQMVNSGHRFAAAAMTMLYAGLRRGEVLALNIDRDVDFDARVIHVREAVHFESNRDKLGKPKTEASVRDVPLVDVLADVLRGKHGLLITGAGGEYMTQSAFKRAWESYLTKTEAMLNGVTQKRWYGKTKEQRQIIADGGELPQWKEFRVRTHDFRHSYCTMLYELGIDIKTAQTWMGHEDEAMTRQVYTHLSNTQLNNATSILQKGVQERFKIRVKQE
jgi:integrase